MKSKPSFYPSFNTTAFFFLKASPVNRHLQDRVEAEEKKKSSDILGRTNRKKKTGTEGESNSVIRERERNEREVYLSWTGITSKKKRE